MTNLIFIHGGVRLSSIQAEGGDHGAGGKTPTPPPILMMLDDA